MTAGNQTKLQVVYSARIRIHYGSKSFPLIKDLRFYLKTGRKDMDAVFNMYSLMGSVFNSQTRPHLEKSYKTHIHAFDVADLKKTGSEVDTSDGMIIDLDQYLAGRRGSQS